MWYFLAVYDGHGGDKTSEYLKEHLYDELFKYPHLLASTPEASLRKVLDKTNC